MRKESCQCLTVNQLLKKYIYFIFYSNFFIFVTLILLYMFNARRVDTRICRRWRIRNVSLKSLHLSTCFTGFRTAWPSLPPYVQTPFSASHCKQCRELSSRSLLSQAVGIKLHTKLLIFRTPGHIKLLIFRTPGHTKLSIFRTPGHTKHFQTIFLTKTVRLCDCPGLGKLFFFNDFF